MVRASRPTEPADGPAPLRQGDDPRELLYQNAYVWFIFVAALDIMLTWLILGLGGRELNGLARLIIDEAGLPGMLLFKFFIVVAVVLLCEAVGRRSYAAGQRVARLAVALTCLPPLLAAAQLLLHIGGRAGSSF